MNTNYQLDENLMAELKMKSVRSEKEICGFILESNDFVEVKNVHPDPKNYFLISPADYIWEKGAILFHSHPSHIDTYGFSKWDLENQFYFQKKMLLYSVKYDEFYFKAP